MASDKSAKDKAMAAFLKRHGVRRTTSNCPHCHRPIPIGAGQHPGARCKGRRG